MANFSLSDLKRFIDSEPNKDFWMGLDVHKKSYHIALLGLQDSTYTWTFPANPQKLLKQIHDLNIHIISICYEAGPTGFQLARTFTEGGIPSIVAAPNKIPRSVSPGSKTDRLDCLKLVRFASKGIIKSITIPSVQEESERALLRRRYQLVDNIRRSKQRIKAQLLYCGTKEPDALKRWRTDSLNAIETLLIPFAEKQVIQSHFRELINLTEEKKKVEHQLHVISQMENHKETVESLMSVPGVGFITAITFHLEIFRPDRFTRAEDISAYLGLAPTVHHSGERNPRGHLVPVGQKRLRSVLIEASWMWIAKDPYAMELYRKFVSRTGIRQKAVAAVARKLAIILWRLSIERRVYRNQAA